MCDKIKFYSFVFYVTVFMFSHHTISKLTLFHLPIRSIRWASFDSTTLYTCIRMTIYSHIYTQFRVRSVLLQPFQLHLHSLIHSRRITIAPTKNSRGKKCVDSIAKVSNLPTEFEIEFGQCLFKSLHCMLCYPFRSYAARNLLFSANGQWNLNFTITRR